MKKIFLCYASNNLHSIYKNMIKNPPDGYEFILPNKSPKKIFLSFLQNSKSIKIVYRFTIKKLIRSLDLYSNMVYSQPPEDIDLTLAFGTIIPGDSSYIIDLPENPFSMAGYNYKIFKKNLELINQNLLKSNCKAVIYSFKDCYNLCAKFFDPKVMEKFVLIRFALKQHPYKKRDYSKIKFLFIGSLSNPDDFEIKGGVETIESFIKLRKEFGEKVELTIKCNVPKWVYKKYNLEGINILNKSISQEELDDLFFSSHVLFVPSHSAVAMTPIEGMSFAMPLIAIDIYGANEYVKNNKNGFLIKPSKKIPYNSEDYPCNVRTKEFIEKLRDSDLEVINEIYINIRKFVLNPKLLEKMGKNSYNLLKTDFSLDKRNRLLKKVFDKFTKS